MRPPGNLDPRFKLKTFEGRLISPGWDPGVTGIGNQVLKGGEGSGPRFHGIFWQSGKQR